MTTPFQPVMLLAHGSPTSLDDLPDFLSSVRGGLPVPPQLIAAYEERYRQIGGHSPLPEITARIAAALARARGRPVYIGMRHGEPTIDCALQQMLDTIPTHSTVSLTAICLTPYYSRMTVGGYEAALRSAVDPYGDRARLTFVKDWYREPDFLRAIQHTIETGLRRLPLSEQGSATIIFSAHSLPERLREAGDPYPQQVYETAQHIAGRLNWPSDRWILAYQSAPPTPEPWLSPNLMDEVRRRAAADAKQILVVPIGFVVDNVEVRYDLDIELQQVAGDLGLRLERAPLLNDAPGLIAALSSAIDRAGPVL